MDFIEISEGVSINKKYIEAVVLAGDKTVVYANGKTYESTFPYMTLLQLLSINEDGDSIKTTLNQILAIQKTQGSYAG